MNQLQKERIIELRSIGVGYRKIANILGLSINTIKSYCRRNKLINNLTESKATTIVSQAFCKQCGNELFQTPGKKPLKFCCNECRTKWWNTHQDKVNKKAIYSFDCSYCNEPFTAYGNSSRKYCSHECYINDRFKGGETV